MFDCEVAELDAEAAADAIAQAHRLRVRLEGRLLELAAHWADLHDHPRLRGWRAVPGGERLRRPGGEGTPEVIDFSAADLGALQETTSGAGWSMMADALDLRHRLPRLWAAVLAGRVRTWKARHIAQATRHLDPAAVDRVDAALDGLVPALPWIRCQSVLAAAIMAADPQAAEAWAAAEEARRFVRAGRTDEHGLKLLIAKATAGEVIWFLAMVDRIADILAADGDPDLVDVRRSKAIGILAQPAVALDLLTRHHDDPSTNPAPAADPNREPDRDRQHDAEAGPHPEPEPETDREPDWEAETDPEAEPHPYPDPDTGHGPAAGPDAEPHPYPEPDHDAAATPCHDGDSNHEAHADPDPEEGLPGAGHLSVRFTPDRPVDPDRARPQVTLYVHLSAEALTAGHGVARIEDVGPVTLHHLTRLLRNHSCRIRLQPVLDPNHQVAVDSYEIPRELRELIRLRQPASAFPYSPTTNRHRTDLDHTIAYQPPSRGGPPGQTRVGNLGPLNRFEHRLKTHGHWQLRQPEPDTYLWRSPYRHTWLVTPTGTHPLGTGPLAQTLWQAAGTLHTNPRGQPSGPPDYVPAA